MLGREVFVNNNLQKDYSYKITHQLGNFSDLVGFTPTLSPLEMIEYGICGGVLFNDVFTDQEYLADIRHLIFKRSARGSSPQRSLNYFKVLPTNIKLPWIGKSDEILGDDPRGWIEWYLRTWLGRRDPKVDRIQVERWKVVHRMLPQLQSLCNPSDHECLPRRRQFLLEYGIDTINRY